MSSRSKSKSDKSHQTLRVVDPNTAGIDLGSEFHFVGVNPDKWPDPVKSFGCFTRDLREMGNWLLARQVTSVAMEATGVYWMPVYEVLVSMGLTVRLVDARKVHNLPGRKSDIQDCQWLRELHSFGLLSSCFVPDADALELRAYYRQREHLVGERSSQIQMMQKSLEQMNLQLHKVLSDITGVTGMQIIHAILAGERDPKVLAALRKPGVRRPEEDIVKALEGTFAKHHLFTLGQAVELYEKLGAMVAEIDTQIKSVIDAWCVKSGRTCEQSEKIRKARKNQVNFNLGAMLSALTGADLTKINGIDTLSALSVISECGLDYTRWKTTKHWASWLRLSPGTRISGGKRLRNSHMPTSSRVAKTFRLAAQSLHRSSCALGIQFRRIAARRGKPVAIKAIARKIAIAFYNIMTKGQEFIDIGAAAYEEQQNKMQLQRVQKYAATLGYTLVQLPVQVEPEPVGVS